MRTALVPVMPSNQERTNVHAGARANADFIAQLIATSVQMPQTRARRRAEPQEATAAYRALGQWPSAPGGTVSRSL